MSQQITTLTFFRYRGFFNKLWAFFMVPITYERLKKVPGQTFFKVMGSGKARFNPWPDWGVYAVIQVWERESYAEAFFKYNRLMGRYHKRTEELATLYMRSMMARGAWSGGNPFQKSSTLDPENRTLAVITRATIKTKLLRKFWKYVPQAQDNLYDNEGLVYTKGLGEVPVTQMATFSIWKDVESLHAFAYKTRAHAQAVKMTRTLDWYREELFSRFQPYRQDGLWEGKNLLGL